MKYEVRAIFNNEEDAQAFKELACGLADKLEFRTIERIVTPSPPLETRLGSRLFARFKEGRSYTLIDVASWCEEEGYSGKSASGMLCKLTDHGHIVRIMDGLYELPKKENENDAPHIVSYFGQEHIKGSK